MTLRQTCSVISFSFFCDSFRFWLRQNGVGFVQDTSPLDMVSPDSSCVWMDEVHPRPFLSLP